MVSVLATRVVDHGFESKSGKSRFNAFFMYPKALGLDICHFNIDSLIFSPMYQWDEQE
jgi:hypothetical protein